MDPVSNLELSNFAIMPSNCFFYNVAILRQRACFRQRLSLAVVSHAGKTASKQLRRPLIVLAVAAMTYGHENCRVCSHTRSHESVIFAYFSD